MTWYSKDWMYRKEITIDGTKISGNHTDFPILFHLDGDADLASHALSNGDDIIFTSSDEVTRIKSERENYIDGSGNIWVRIPNLTDATNETIFMYYGNPTGGDQEEVAGYKPSGVWNDNFVLVHHMKDTTTSTISDSTKNGYDGTKRASNEPIEIKNSMVGAAQDFDGVNDYINLGTAAASGSYDTMTIEAWINRTSNTPSGWKTHLHRNEGTTVGSSEFFIGMETGVNYQIVATIGAGDGPGYMAGATGVNSIIGDWYYVVNSWDGTTARVYVNGVEKTTYGLASAAFANNLAASTRIGASGDGSGYLIKGYIDEVRISNNNKSVGWIRTTYNNISSSTTFLTVNNEFQGVKKWISPRSRIMRRSQYNIS